MSKMKTTVSSKKKRKIIRLSIILAIVVILVVGGILFIPKLLDANNDTGTTLQKRTAEVSEGDITKSIGASAPIVSSEKLSYKPESASEIVDILVEDGSYAAAGDIIMILDTSSTDSNIQALEDEVDGKKSQIEDKQDLVEDKYISIDELREDITDKKEDISDLNADISDIKDQIDDNEATRAELVVAAPIDGTIFDINVSIGDMVSTNTVYATVTDPSSYEIEMSFSSDILEDSIQEVEVNYLNNTFEGEILSFAGYTYKDQFGKELIDVVIAFTTDISLTKDSDLTAKISAGEREFRSVTEGNPYFAATENITSEVSGEILELFISEKQSVEQGDPVAILDGEVIDDKTDSLNSQIESLENQIDGLNDQIDTYYSNIDSYYEDIADINEDITVLNDDITELDDEIETVKEGYEDANIKADFNGIVTEINVNIGDSVNTNTSLFTLVSMDNPNMVVAIDELDIAEITDNLEVSVIIDALPATETTPITAFVNSISLEGDYQGGVTTYDVTVTLTGDVEGFRLGMNATATIFTSKSENTLYIPIEAVTIQNGRSFVYVEDDSVIGAPVSDIQSNVNADAMVGDATSTEGVGTSGGSGGSGGRSNVDTSTMTEEELAAFKARLAEKGMTLEDVQAQQDAATEDTATDSTALLDYYSGTRIVEVTTGIYNALYIEILDGLNVGDVVVLPPLYTSADTTSTEESGMIGIPGITGTGGGSGTGRPAGSLPGGGK